MKDAKLIIKHNCYNRLSDVKIILKMTKKIAFQKDPKAAYFNTKNTSTEINCMCVSALTRSVC